MPYAKHHIKKKEKERNKRRVLEGDFKDRIDYKEYYQKNKKLIKEKYKSKYKKTHKEYYQKHKNEILKRNDIYKRNRRKLDKNFDTLLRLRNRVTMAFRLKNINKIKTADKYGINYQSIIKHLGPCPGERNNYHIDHIKPLCKFNFNDLKQIKLAFAPENHQWLLAEDNLRKSAKLNYNPRKALGGV